jgi:hypothetical protein
MCVRSDKAVMIVAVVAVAVMLMVQHKGKLVLLECQREFFTFWEKPQRL